jgi:hypothetical protein
VKHLDHATGVDGEIVEGVDDDESQSIKHLNHAAGYWRGRRWRRTEPRVPVNKYLATQLGIGELVEGVEPSHESQGVKHLGHAARV